jgi:hypothetical protein
VKDMMPIPVAPAICGLNQNAIVVIANIVATDRKIQNILVKKIFDS